MRLLAAIVICCAILAHPSAARAGLYHRDALGAFDIDENGHAIPLSPESFLLALGAVKETDWTPAARINRPEPPERYVALKKSIEDRRTKGIRRLSDDEKIALCTDLLRFRYDAGSVNQALDILNELARRPSRENGFLIFSTFADALQLQNQRRDSFLKELEALGHGFPTKLLGLNSKQLAWYERFERDYHVRFLSHRMRQDEGPKNSHGLLELDPLFRAKETGEPVRCVGDSGQWKPGTIAAAEKAKLPADAIAILQQLLLWYPSDDRLVWQLAELYNALGDLPAADRLFDMCVKEMYTKSQEARDHRTQLKERIDFIRAETQRMQDEKKKSEEEAKRRAEEEKRQRYLAVGAVVAFVLVVLLYWQSREFLRRFGGRKRMTPSQPMDAKGSDP